MRSPLATSASRPSLHGATAGTIPASLMGHGQVKGLVADDAPVVYRRSVSVLALRNAVTALEPGRVG